MSLAALAIQRPCVSPARSAAWSRGGAWSGRHNFDAKPVQHSTVPASVAAGTAHLTRVLFTGVQPNQALRNVLTKRPPIPRGPFSAVVIILSILSMLYAAYRRFIVARTKQCASCRGYGIEQCDLCDGTGSIRWEAKWDHVEPCPRCMGRRFTNCSNCGGLHQRTLFSHVTRNRGLAAVRKYEREVIDSLEPVMD